MANLFQVTVVRRDSSLLNPTTTAYLNPRFVVHANQRSYQDGLGNTNLGTEIDYKLADGTWIREYIVTEAASTINTRMNTANTTNSVNRIPITVVKADGTTYSDSVNVADIVYAQNHPADNSDCLLQVNVPTLDQMPTLRIDGTAAALAALTNA